LQRTVFFPIKVSKQLEFSTSKRTMNKAGMEDKL